MELFLLPHRLKPFGLQATNPTKGAPQSRPKAARGARAAPPESRGGPCGVAAGPGGARRGPRTYEEGSGAKKSTAKPK